MNGLHLPVETVWARILTRVTPSDSGCWEWPGAVNSRGYGLISAGKRGTSVLTHRVAVAQRDGAIPDDLTVDHLCRNKLCCNPDHLEVVTLAENCRRDREHRGFHLGGQCGSGHPLTEGTTYRHPRGQLVCRACSEAHHVAHMRRTSETYRIREWARSVGLTVTDRGRLPRRIREAYLIAHEQAAA